MKKILFVLSFSFIIFGSIGLYTYASTNIEGTSNETSKLDSNENVVTDNTLENIHEVIAELLSNGDITQDQADRLTESLDQNICTEKQRFNIFEFLGISKDDITKEMTQEEILVIVNESLDELILSEEITQEEADEYLLKIEEHLTMNQNQEQNRHRHNFRSNRDSEYNEFYEEPLLENEDIV